MVQVELGSVTALIMAHPLTIRVHVGRFGMLGLIAKALVLLWRGVILRGRMLLLTRCSGRSGRGLGSTRRSISAANVLLTAACMPALMLGERAR
jgi:hypothetical protein